MTQRYNEFPSFPFQYLSYYMLVQLGHAVQDSLLWLFFLFTLISPLGISNKGVFYSFILSPILHCHANWVKIWDYILWNIHGSLQYFIIYIILKCPELRKAWKIFIWEQEGRSLKWKRSYFFNPLGEPKH